MSLAKVCGEYEQKSPTNLSIPFIFEVLRELKCRKSSTSKLLFSGLDFPNCRRTQHIGFVHMRRHFFSHLYNQGFHLFLL